MGHPPKATAEVVMLCDNKARPGLDSAHGLSALLRSEDFCLLVDAGPDETAVRNADALRVDLSDVEAIVLTHGHWDHTGGLAPVLRRTGPARVLAHPAAFEDTYSLSGGDEPRYIGAPARIDEYEDMGATFELVATPVALGGPFHTTGQVTRRQPLDATASGLLRKSATGLAPDTHPDDMSVGILVDEGVVVVTGCAHAGLGNIVQHASRLWGPVVGVLGGMHLSSHPDDAVAKIGHELSGLGVRTLGPCHCTGDQATQVLARSFPGRVIPLRGGDRIRVWPDGRIDIS